MDTLDPFIFEHTPIRGNIATLDISYKDALQHQHLPPVLKQALGELMAASVLLISTIKMKGALVLQMQTNGALKLLVVECTSDLSIRATAKWDETLSDQSFKTLVEGGQFVITLDPEIGEAYQGIVGLEGDSVAAMLQNYMLRSQQIDTSIWLTCDEHKASGMLLQKLPSVQNDEQQNEDAEAWNRINALANTVKNDELLSLSSTEILHRLFHEEDVRLFDARPIQAHCSCTRENVGNMLSMLGKTEIDHIIAEQGSVEVNCDFCNKQYVFDEQDVSQLEPSDTPSSLNKKIH